MKLRLMEGQSRRWMILVAIIWIQAFTGTNFDFSAYSSDLKAALKISQVQLNYLATASDLGKALGWSSGLALLYIPLPAVLILAALFGLVAYGMQWLLIINTIQLSYFPVFLLCLLAGCSICWFNTVCFVLCIRNFPANRSLALSLTISFNGLSAALYTLASNAVGGSSAAYLFLNATVPVLVSIVALFPILRQPPIHLVSQLPKDAPRDHDIFLVLNALAFLTGLYLLFLNSFSSVAPNARLLLCGAILLLLLPLGIPGFVYGRKLARRTIYSISRFDSRIVSSVEDLELQKPLIEETSGLEGSNVNVSSANGSKGTSVDTVNYVVCDDNVTGQSSSWWWCWCCDGLMEKDRLSAIGQEHLAKRLIRHIDFWLYYAAYFFGATVGLVYSNNLGQIAQSLGRESQIKMLVTLYSSCSFFGRLLAAAPDFLREFGMGYFARTGWLAIAIVPMPLAFFLLAEANDMHALLAGTALIGLSSGFIFAAAVTITSELFGANGLGVNHNILITNIPIGSLLYGMLAALVYDANGKVMLTLLGDRMVVCMGRKCYAKTFLGWGCITLLGLASSMILYFRTRLIYLKAESRQIPTEPVQS